MAVFLTPHNNGISSVSLFLFIDLLLKSMTDYGLSCLSLFLFCFFFCRLQSKADIYNEPSLSGHLL